MNKTEIQLPVSELKRAFAGLNKVMGKSTLPTLRCVRLDRLENGEITLTVTDLDSQVTYGLEGGVLNAPATLLIPWELFRKAATSSSEHAVFINEKPDTIVVRTFVGGMPFEEPATMPPLDEWPVIPKMTGDYFNCGPTFKTALAEALSYASTDAGRFVLNGACLDVRGSEGHYVVGTDATQIYSANTFKFDLPSSIIVPNRKFLTWSGFLDNGDWQLRVLPSVGGKEGGWVELTSDRWVFQTKLIDGEYPNWRQVFPIETNGLTVVRLQSEAVAMLLEVAPAVRTGDNRTEAICLSTKGGKLFLNNRTVAPGPWNPIEVPGALAVGPQKAVHVSRDRFLKALRMGFHELELRDPQTPMVLRAPGKQMALALYRGDAPQPSVEESGPSAPQPPNSTAQERNPVNAINDRNKPLTQSAPANAESEQNPIRTAIAQVDQVRNQFRDCLNGLNQAMTQLKAAERDQKMTAKEIDSVRGTLRSLQRVQI